MSNNTDWLSMQYSCTHWEWGRQGAKPKLIDLRAVSIAAFIESHHAVRIEEKSMEMALSYCTIHCTALLDDPVTPRSNCLCAHYCFWAGTKKRNFIGKPMISENNKEKSNTAVPCISSQTLSQISRRGKTVFSEQAARNTGYPYV